MLYSNVSIIKDVMLKCVCVRFKRNPLLVPWNKEKKRNLTLIFTHKPRSEKARQIIYGRLG